MTAGPNAVEEPAYNVKPGGEAGRLTATMLRKRFSILCLVMLFASATHALFGLDEQEARHLLLRTGFNATAAEIAALEPLSRAEAVDRIVDEAAASVTRPAVTPPAWTEQTPDSVPRPDLRNLEDDAATAAKKSYRTAVDARDDDLRTWEIRELIQTPTPFAEWMVLFWHNNFTSSIEKVDDPGLLFNQDRIIRQYAFGSFAQMVHAVSKDPAMLIYLDNETNTKGKPNENYARELMELFTLGVGNYTEQDIKQSARAFTGWRVDLKTMTFETVPRLHDDGVKTFLGRTGNFDGDDIVDIILADDQTAIYITTKLWEALVSPTPDSEQIRAIAASFRDSGYEIEPLVTALLDSPAFWDPANRGNLVKSPVELLIGAIRELGVTSIDPKRLAGELRSLGQDLFNPPTVKGWPTDTGWIDSETLLARRDDLQRIFAAYRAQLGASPGNSSGYVQPASLSNVVLLSVAPADPCRASRQTLDCVRRALLDPAYQVK